MISALPQEILEEVVDGRERVNDKRTILNTSERVFSCLTKLKALTTLLERECGTMRFQTQSIRDGLKDRKKVTLQLCD